MHRSRFLTGDDIADHEAASWHRGHPRPLDPQILFGNVIPDLSGQHDRRLLHEFDGDPLTWTAMVDGVVSAALRNGIPTRAKLARVRSCWNSGYSVTSALDLHLRMRICHCCRQLRNFPDLVGTHQRHEQVLAVAVRPSIEALHATLPEQRLLDCFRHCALAREKVGS